MSRLQGTPSDSYAPSPREAVLEYQRRLFQKLLRKVWDESAFYRDYYASHGIREQELAEVTIGDLPFLSKKILMENFDRATTDARLRRRELEQWLDGVRDPKQLFVGDFIVINGSGSSGTTGIFVYSRTDWQVMNSIMASRLPQPENYPAGKTRVAFYRVAHGHFAGVSTAVHLPKAVYDTLIVSFLGSAKDVIEQLQRFQPHRLTGYSSSVTVLAEQAIGGKLRIQPQRIFVSGDLLTKDMEQKIHQAWGAPISNLYGASESLFLAVKDADDEEMTAMDDLNILEILDEQNRPVGPGEEGRVTITNLYNYTVPILRYELDDYVTKGNRPRASGLSSIQAIRPGKTHDALPIVLDNGARDTLISGAMTSFYAAGLERAQFIFRPPDRIQIDYLAKQNIDHAVRSEFQRILNMKGASRMTFEVRRVSSILADPVTGKVRLVLPHGSQTGPSSPVFVNDVHPEVLVERVSVPKSALVFKKTDVEQSIPERFEQLVQKHSDRPAIKSRGQSLTYNELNRAGNRVAQAILARRGEGEEPIALLLGHTIPALVTILGVLKAGKFYVPLSPSYPRARLAAMVEDADASLIVTNNSNLPSALALAGDARHILNIDDLDANLPDRNPGLSIRSDALAYLLYTSGSTGRPKGVVQTHRNVLHQIMTYSNGLTISAADRLTLLHSHCFSASRLDIFGALLNGAALFPLPVAQEGVVNLAQRLIEEEITVFHWVPTAFRQFIDGLSGQERFPKLRLIVLGSEPLAPADVEMYKKHFAPSCVLVNRYGTTETGNVRWYFIDKQTQIPADVVPVGYAIEDTEVFILDETGNELGNHQVGEIAVKGPYLAPGYWKQAELSRAAFLSDPLAPEKKIYRTGDMGYMLPDGCMFHVGRKDFQVKVRGHRVELGEIEKALRGHTAIRAAVVVAREKMPGEKRLVAYFVVGQETPPTVSALRGFLEARLPSYMIPELFVQLENLPLLPNGKLDRGALPPLDGARPAMDTPIAEPRTPVENALAQIWSESLGVSRIGIHDNFFDLGGHSLLAGKIISRVTGTFKVEITFRDFFELPTVAHMANIITRNATVLGDEQLIKILNELDLLSDEKARELLEQNRK